MQQNIHSIGGGVFSKAGKVEQFKLTADSKLALSLDQCGSLFFSAVNFLRWAAIHYAQYKC